MIAETDKDYLRLIIKHYTEIINLISEFQENCFIPGSLAYRALCTDIMLIGVKAANLSSEFQGKYPHIQWSCIRGMRDRIIEDDAWLNGSAVRLALLEDMSMLYNLCLQVLYLGSVERS